MPPICPRCQLALCAPHETESDCVAALGAEIASMRHAVETLKADLAARQAQDERARQLHAEAEADLERGG